MPAEYVVVIAVMPGRIGTASTSPVWKVASVTVIDAMLAKPAGLFTVACTMFSIGTAPLLPVAPLLYQLVVKFGVPEPAPTVKMIVGGMLIVATAVLPSTVPSLATTLAVSTFTVGPPAVLSYVTLRSTVW